MKIFYKIKAFLRDPKVARFIFPILVVFFVSTFFLARAEPAQALGMWDLMKTPLILFGWAAAVILSMILGCVGVIVHMLIFLLIAVASYNGFTTSAAVIKGWVVVRDIGNMVFIIALLIIAIATILKIETYQWKKALPKLIIMAVLINFSKTICGLFIDFAQVVMMTFVNAFKVGGTGIFASFVGIGQSLSANTGIEGGLDTIFSFDKIIATLGLALIRTIIAGVVICVMLIVLLARMAMLWILVVLSPLAFAMASFPQGQKYASQWWQKFGNYVIVGPLLAFFLWLAFATMSGPSAANKIISPDQAATIDTPPVVGSAEGGGWEAVLSFGIGIAMLIGGLMLTQQLGVAGGSMAGAAVQQIQKQGKNAVNYGLERASAATGVELRPQKWVERFGEMRQDSRRKREAQIASKAIDRMTTEKTGLRGTLTRTLGYTGAPREAMESIASATGRQIKEGYTKVGGATKFIEVGSLKVAGKGVEVMGKGLEKGLKAIGGEKIIEGSEKYGKKLTEGAAKIPGGAVNLADRIIGGAKRKLGGESPEQIKVRQAEIEQNVDRATRRQKMLVSEIARYDPARAAQMSNEIETKEAERKEKKLKDGKKNLPDDRGDLEQQMSAENNLQKEIQLKFIADQLPIPKEVEIGIEIDDKDIFKKMGEITAKREAGTEAGYTKGEQNKLLSERGFARGSKEADNFFEDWDLEKATEVLREEKITKKVDELKKNSTDKERGEVLKEKGLNLASPEAGKTLDAHYRELAKVELVAVPAKAKEIRERPEFKDTDSILAANGKADASAGEKKAFLAGHFDKLALAELVGQAGTTAETRGEAGEAAKKTFESANTASTNNRTEIASKISKHEQVDFQIKQQQDIQAQLKQETAEHGKDDVAYWTSRGTEMKLADATKKIEQSLLSMRSGFDPEKNMAIIRSSLAAQKGVKDITDKEFSKQLYDWRKAGKFYSSEAEIDKYSKSKPV
jgi:hypothetical protein